MKLIIGLGNPGLKYAKTRHNAGFMAASAFGKQLSATSFKFSKKFEAEIAETKLKGEKTLLVKPRTYMNKSGESIRVLVNFYKLDPKKDIIVIYDDLDLPLGKIRTTGKSAAGHQGMQSVINALGTDEIQRIRIGICPPERKPARPAGGPKIPTDKFVLQKFTKEERKIIEEIIEKINP